MLHINEGTSVGGDDTVVVYMMLVVLVVCGIIADDAVHHLQFRIAYHIIIRSVPLAVHIDGGTFRSGTVGNHAVSQLVARHVDTFLFRYGLVADQQSATGSRCYGCLDIMCITIGECETIHYTLLCIDHGDDVSGVVRKSACSAGAGDVRSDPADIGMRVPFAGIGSRQGSRIAAVQTHVALYTGRRGTDIAVDVVTRSHRCERTFLHEDLDELIPFRLAGRHAVGIQLRDHIVMVSHVVHHVLAEVTERLPQVTGRHIPAVTFLGLRYELTVRVEHTLSVRVNEECRDRVFA